MEENNEEQKSNQTEDVNTRVTEATTETKIEAKAETNQEVKENVASKNSTIKKDYTATKNFFKNFFKTPYDEIKKVAEAPKSYFIIILVAFIAWVAANLIDGIIGVASSILRSPYPNLFTYFKYSLDTIGDLFIAVLSPAIIIAVIALIIFLFMKNKNKKKGYMTIASTLIVAYIPVISASIISLLGNVNTTVAKLTSTYSSFCSVITAILTYFAIKALYNEENDNKATITYLITMGIYFAFVFILKVFGLYI